MTGLDLVRCSVGGDYRLDHNNKPVYQEPCHATPTHRYRSAGMAEGHWGSPVRSACRLVGPQLRNGGAAGRRSVSTDTQPTGQPLDLDAVRRSFDHYREHQGHSWARGWSCCSAHGPADHVPALFAEIERLRFELAAMTDLHDQKHRDWQEVDNARQRLLVERANLRADAQRDGGEMP